MKNNTKWFVVALFAMLLQVSIYVYFQLTLVEGYNELTIEATIVSLVLIVLFVVLFGIHLLFFYRTINQVPSKKSINWKVAISLVLLPLSSVILLSDVTLLSDIGKEYLFFDVSNEWIMLYLFFGLHLFTICYAFLIIKTLPKETHKLSEIIKTGNEQMFRTLYQVILLSSVLGVIFSLFFIIEPIDFLLYEKYIVELSIIMAMLLVFPITLFLGYWYIKTHGLPIKEWFDENEMLITTRGMSIALVVGWIGIILGVILSFFLSEIAFILWLILIIFIQLFSLSISVLNKYRM